MASWDKSAIAATKAIINERTSFPTAAQWEEGFSAFSALVNTAVVKERIAAFEKAGLQEDLEFELNMAKEALNYTGLPPYPHPAS